MSFSPEPPGATVPTVPQLPPAPGPPLSKPPPPSTPAFNGRSPLEHHRGALFFPASPSASVGRRRSQIQMNLQIADPAIPSPGEMVSDAWSASYRAGSPHFPPSPQPMYAADRQNRQHFRTPSLGELHQELESEQEFQVNRLLVEINRLQAQVQRQQSGGEHSAGSAAGDDYSAPPSAFPGSLPRSPGFPPHARGSFDLARSDLARADLSRRSRTSSRGPSSPALRTTSIGESDRLNLAGRDENAFYQAETQMLVRENQMLRLRIKELEKNLAEAAGTAATANITHEPPQASHLHESTSASAEASSQQGQSSGPEVPKEAQQ